MDDTTIEGLEGQLLQGAVALMLGWSDLHLGPGEWGEVLLGIPPRLSRATPRRGPVPAYHESVDACLADLVPWMRSEPRGFELTLATDAPTSSRGDRPATADLKGDLPRIVAWFTRVPAPGSAAGVESGAGEEIEVSSEALGEDLPALAATALCRAALKAHERVTGNGESAIA